MRVRIPSFLSFGLGAMVLAGCLGCAGDRPEAGTPVGPVAAATKLVYTDPGVSGYRLVQDASSTDGHLVLNLVGPPEARIRGGVFTLSLNDTPVVWGHPGGSDPYLREGQVLPLGTLSVQ
jgi:hypothetical protein